MKHLFYILIIFISLNSCSEYQKALKSEETSEKFTVGVKKYEEGKYNKANRLFQQIVPNYRGKPQAEKLMFLYADTFFQTEDFYSAGYQYGRFVTAYPKSEKIEEAAYKSALSYYKLSPVYSKNQEETYEALEKLQLFANIYPDSKYLPEINSMVKELDYKLEKKAFEIAKQYNRIAPAMGTFKACLTSCNNFLSDFPGSSFKEEIMYIRYATAKELAAKSVEWKKEERLDDAQKYLEILKNTFPNTQFLDNSEKEEKEEKVIAEETK
ncbi:outer membrane protein assembly factor BamD [Aurantibacter sp.]|uniref:outer membrane protein assembly factor BamD n=1 Tax=Aurantibacter sp. TaxID=2807103 RepID=UPI0035C7ECD9